MEVNEEKAKILKKKGFWTPQEDFILKQYVEIHGECKWRTVSEKSGLKRGGRSCRLRWKNYLRPNVKRGEMSEDEKDLIIRLHKLLGNRWSLIAGRLPGRTDNEVKNYWNTHLHKVASGDKTKQLKVDSTPKPLQTSPEEVSKSTTLSEEDGGNINYDVESLLLKDYEPVICDEETFSLTADNIMFPAFGSCYGEALPFEDNGFHSFLLT